MIEVSIKMVYLIKKHVVMTIVIKKSDNEERIHQIMKSLHLMKKFDAYKYCGMIPLEKSPLEIQRELRDEWE